MSQWFFIQPGQTARTGPLDPDAAFAHVQSHPDALCWRQGLSGWQPARAIPEFADAFGDGLTDDMPPIPSAASPANVASTTRRIASDERKE